MADDLFEKLPQSSGDPYDGSAIEVLEGLEPVRRRPGMYIGGTDERALHHLAAEVLDNSMDEAVAGHANRIEVTLEEEAGSPGRLTITDNGRGIPVDEHPKYPGKSALEVILTTLHSGGKFSGKAYATSGGLHGVGVSVVNALSTLTRIEVARNKELYAQEFSRGLPTGPLQHLGGTPNRRGTSVTFVPDTEIFGEDAKFKPARLFKLVRSKAYLFAGVEIRWKCAASLASEEVPAEAVFQFPGGLADHLKDQLGTRECVTSQFFSGSQDFPGDEQGRVEWAVAWPLWSDGAYSWYCNTIPTPDGGTHEAGLRAALTKGIRAFADLVGQKKAKDIAPEDVITGSEIMLSVFIRDPQFQSQTKDRLTSPEAARMVENAVRDHFDHFLADNMERGKALLGHVLERMDERLRRKQEREVKRKTATNARKLRLPGKLTEQRRQLVRHYKAALPEPGAEFADPEAERAAFLVFLHFARLSAAGQTGARVDANLASQTAIVQGFAGFHPVDVVIREDQLQAGLDYLAAEVGSAVQMVAVDMAYRDQLARIHDRTLEKAAANAYPRDYAGFGFGPYNP